MTVNKRAVGLSAAAYVSMCLYALAGYQLLRTISMPTVCAQTSPPRDVVAGPVADGVTHNPVSSLTGLAEYGALVLVLGFAGYCLIWAGKRLFGTPDGIFTKIGDRYTLFVDEAASAMDAYANKQKECIALQTASATAHATMAKQLEEFCSKYSCSHCYSTIEIKEAWLHACDIMERIAEKLQVDVTKDLEHIRDKLKEVHGHRH